MVEKYLRSKEAKIFSPFPLPNLHNYGVVAQPEGEDEGFWAGGCCSLKDNKEKIWLIYRLRNPEKRGYKLCIATSQNGVNFQVVKELKKEEFGNIESLERASILQDLYSGKYKLYPSLEKEGKWYIYKLDDANSPEDFDPSTARPVFAPSAKAKDSRKAKDPYIINFFNTWYMFYSGSGKDPQEETFLATSQDGEKWIRKGLVLPRSYWHEYHTRMSCLIPTEKGFIYLYEGSSFSWYEPHFNLNVGFGYTVDMRNFFDLTTQEPSLYSSTRGNFSTIRYMDYVFLNDKVLFYYEAARDNGAFELRVTECENIKI